jgi:hypothetical protein
VKGNGISDAGRTGDNSGPCKRRISRLINIPVGMPLP